MGRVRNLLDTLNLTTPEELARFVSNALKEIQQIINGNISFQDNFRGKIVDFNFTATNTDTRIVHGLGYVPSGYIVVQTNVGVVVNDGSIQTTSTDIWLKGNAISSGKILIF